MDTMSRCKGGLRSPRAGRRAALTGAALLAGLAAPPTASATFIDDFNGPFLAPHWTTIPRADDWRYDLAGQRLNVYSISAEGSPPFDPVVWMIAPLAQTYIDPEVRIVFGFDGPVLRRQVGAVFSPNGALTLSQTATGEITLEAAGYGVFERHTLLGNGPFDVRMFRSLGQTVVTVNGSELFRRLGAGGNEVRQVELNFRAPRFAQIGPAFVDHVSVIPCPGGFGVGAAVALRLAYRRERQRSRTT